MYYHTVCDTLRDTLKGIVEFLFQTANAFKVHGYALIIIYDISSALLGPKIAMKVILDPKMCEI